MVKSPDKCGDTLRTGCVENKMKYMVKKLFGVLPLRKKLFAFDKSEKNCTFKLGVGKKCLITKEKP